MKKRVMIVGASAWQVPMIQKAKELGYEVGVLDYNPNAVGRKYADSFFEVSTIDAEGVCKATKEYGASGITTVATDMPMRAIAYTCEQLGLIGIDQATAVRATDKAEMIHAFKEHNVPHPWYYIVKNGDIDAVRDKLAYPCICKPVDNSASRGVIRIDTEQELNQALSYSMKNGRSGDVIIEQLLIGNEISVEAFAVNGIVSVLAITDKLTTGAPYFVEMGHSQPSKFTSSMKERIVVTAAAAMKAVGIKNGPAHVEMMVTEEGPIMIELGARLGGDFITTDLVPLSTGIDMLGATIHIACGESVDISPKIEKCSAIRYMKTAFGKLARVDGLEAANSIEGVHRVAMLKPVGEEATEIHNSLDRVGYAIAQADTVCDAVELCEKALGNVKVHVVEQ